jgi:hypothetical protein
MKRAYAELFQQVQASKEELQHASIAIANWGRGFQTLETRAAGEKQ